MRGEQLTIILMCYNEREYIAKTIENILRLKPDNSKLIVGDNSSKDGTDAIICEYLSGRTDVKLIMRNKNIGGLENFNDLCKNVETKYLIFASAHDLWGENYLEVLLSHIEKTPECAIAYAPTTWIDQSGNNLDYASSELPTTGLNATKSFIAISIANQHYLNGIIRTEWLKSTRLNLPILGSYEIWLQELATFGDFDLVSGTTWFRRQNREPKNRLQILQRYQKSLFGDTGNAQRFKFAPGMQYLMSYLFLPIFMQNLNLKQRMSLFREALFIFLRKFPSMLKNDFVYMLSQIR